jgi:hypothetical protein
MSRDWIVYRIIEVWPLAWVPRPARGAAGSARVRAQGQSPAYAVPGPGLSPRSIPLISTRCRGVILKHLAAADMIFLGRMWWKG